MEKEKIREALKAVEDQLNECELKCDGPHLVVLDRGWIFHGNLIPLETPTGSYNLTSCVNVRYFKKVGFGGLTKGAKYAEAILDPCEPISFKEPKVIFKVATKSDWRDI